MTSLHFGKIQKSYAIAYEKTAKEVHTVNCFDKSGVFFI